MKNQIIKGAVIAAIASASFQATAEEASWNISGWINESMTYYDDGERSDVVAGSDNGTTLGSRITISGSTPLANTGLTAGFEFILEPSVLNDPLLVSSQESFENSNDFLGGVSILSQNIHLAGAFGKLTIGTQSMPTDNIAVLADPSLTLWSTISPIFRGNGFTITDGAGATWGTFLQCFGSANLNIGIDCNGPYRSGIRYDLPAFGPVSVAVGYANDDIYDVAVKYSGNVGRMTVNVHGGYTYDANGGGRVAIDPTDPGGSDTFQIQAGLMDSVTGLFGSIAYQYDEADDAAVGASDESDAWWFKGGIKKQWNPIGDTAISFNYGEYSDQYGATAGVTGSEVQRWGVSLDQYFGSNLIIYGNYQNLSLDVDGTNVYDGAEDLDMFTLGLTYFF